MKIRFILGALATSICVFSAPVFAGDENDSFLYELCAGNVENAKFYIDNNFVNPQVWDRDILIALIDEGCAFPKESYSYAVQFSKGINAKFSGQNRRGAPTVTILTHYLANTRQVSGPFVDFLISAGADPFIPMSIPGRNSNREIYPICWMLAAGLYREANRVLDMAGPDKAIPVECDFDGRQNIDDSVYALIINDQSDASAGVKHEMIARLMNEKKVSFPYIFAHFFYNSSSGLFFLNKNAGDRAVWEKVFQLFLDERMNINSKIDDKTILKKVLENADDTWKIPAAKYLMAHGAAL